MAKWKFGKPLVCFSLILHSILDGIERSKVCVHTTVHTDYRLIGVCLSVAQKTADKLKTQKQLQVLTVCVCMCVSANVCVLL